MRLGAYKVRREKLSILQNPDKHFTFFKVGVSVRKRELLQAGSTADNISGI